MLELHINFNKPSKLQEATGIPREMNEPKLINDWTENERSDSIAGDPIAALKMNDIKCFLGK